MILKEYYETRNPLGCKLSNHYLTNGIDNFFFKGINSDDEILKIFIELLSSKILDMLNINHISYRYYTWEGIRGTLSDNLLDSGYEIISVRDLITKYQEFTNEKRSYSLNTILKALDHYFKAYPNYQIQKEEFIKNITDMYLFDLLILNSDRKLTDTYVMFNSQEFYLGPLFNHNKAFNKEQNIGFSLMNVSLDSLLNESGEDVYKKMAEFLSTITPKLISKLINEIEIENPLFIDSNSKQLLKNIFKKNYLLLSQIILNHNMDHNNSNPQSFELTKSNKR